MSRDFKVISGGRQQQAARRIISDEEKLEHFQNVTGTVLDDALHTWNELWKEMKGTVTDAYLILPEAEQGFKPDCGWPEFLEKMWLLKHYIDYAKRFSDGKI